MRKPPSPESMIVGHSNGGKGLWRRILSNKAIMIGVKLAMSAKKNEMMRNRLVLIANISGL